MEALYRFVSGAAAGLLSLFAPLAPSVWCVVVFVGIDFVSGVAADRATARRDGRRWFFESRAAWRTVEKAGFVLTALAMTWLLECCVLGTEGLHLTRMAAGFVCGVELWSFLENASQLSDARIFVWLRRFVHRRIAKEVGDESWDKES